MQHLNITYRFCRVLASVLLLLTVPATANQQASPEPSLLPPVNDKAIRSRFDQQLTALMESGRTAEIDKLLAGLQTTKVHANYRFAAPSPDSTQSTAATLLQRARAASLIFGRVFQCGKCDRWHGNYSGAVLIDPAGIAVTNYHVLDDKNSGAFGAMDAEGNMYPVTEILAASKQDDVAVVRLGKGKRKGNFPFVALSKGDPTGAAIRVISHPDGNFYTVSQGIIARYFVHEKSGAPRVQITADFARGSSGSGVFNFRGELTGIVVATNSLYYDQHDGVQKNLQMVVKSCAPAASIRTLFD